MKKQILTAVCAAVVTFTPLTRVLAQAQPETAPVAAPAESGPTAEFKALFGKISVKLKAGQTTEAQLAPEIKEFDALLAKYASQKTDEVAKISFMKARLYIEVFEDIPKGIALLKQTKADFPGTEIAGKLDQVIDTLEKQLAAEANLAVGKPFPAFAEQDLDGKPISLANYKGKIVLVDFWATWCGPCVNELPNVIAAYEKFHGKGFEIIGISLDQQREKLTDFIKENKVTWAQYFDGQGWQNKLAQQYGITSIPATFLVDGDGKIIAKNLRGEALGAKLATLLK